MSDPSIAQQIDGLDKQLTQLKVRYEQYFLGIEAREPVAMRGDVEKAFRQLSGSRLQNTADRFKFNSLNSRLQTFRRQWDETLRKMEAGTYKRHLFKANLRERERASAQAENARGAARASKGASRGANLFDDYLSAARECGQSTKGLTPEKLQAVIAKQEAAIRSKHGVDEVRFKVAVEGGRVKLKATAVRS